MFKNFKNDIKEVEKEVHEPITKETMEKIIKLITVAHETGSQFNLKLVLSIGDFVLDSDAYTGIKILNKSKSDNDRVVISYQNALLSNDTVIEINNIIGYCLDINFCDKNEEFY